MILQEINMLHFLWLIPMLASVYIYAWQKRKSALKLFIDAGLMDRIPVSVSLLKRFWKSVSVLIALLFIVISMARPAWNPKPETIERSGRDVVFLLDVSKSMLAEDIAPNRFESKQFSDYKDQFQWFVGFGLLFLVLDVFLLNKKTKWVQKLNLFNER